MTSTIGWERKFDQQNETRRKLDYEPVVKQYDLVCHICTKEFRCPSKKRMRCSDVCDRINQSRKYKQKKYGGVTKK